MYCICILYMYTYSNLYTIYMLFHMQLERSHNAHTGMLIAIWHNTRSVLAPCVVILFIYSNCGQPSASRKAREFSVRAYAWWQKENIYPRICAHMKFEKKKLRLYADRRQEARASTNTGASAHLHGGEQYAKEDLKMIIIIKCVQPRMRRVCNTSCIFLIFFYFA